jgi:hypothetical protein
MTGRQQRPPRRVAVTSPQTRIALAGRHGPPARAPRLTAGELERAEVVRRRQLRLAVTALLAGAAFLGGLPLLLDLAPALDRVRLLGVPVSWLAVGVLPWPVLAGLAWWQLRRAEAAERPEAERRAVAPVDRPGARDAGRPSAVPAQRTGTRDIGRPSAVSAERTESRDARGGP